MGLKTCVIVATYNGASFLDAQFESLFNQSIKPDHIVVRDDASSDDTIDVLLKLRERNSVPIEVIRGEENLGYSANFSKALAAAQADVYFYCDQDDVWLPEKIERHLDVYYRDAGALLVVSNQEIVGPRLERSGRTTLEEIVARRGDNSQFVHGCCTSFSRSLHELALKPRAGLAHDAWVHLIAELCLGRRVLETPLQLFRRHDGNTTSSDFNSFADREVRRGWTSASEVAATLEGKMHHLREIGLAISQSTALPEHVIRSAQLRAMREADLLEERAKHLTMGFTGIAPILRDLVLGRRAVRSSMGDLLRVIREPQKGR